jgi:uncharacterized membrane protein
VNLLVTPLGVIGLAAVAYMLYIFANLSRRLGAVTKMKPYYRGFYVAIGLLIISILARVTLSSLALAPEPRNDLVSTPLFSLVAYHIPFALAMATSVALAWRYWSWLFKEKLS